MTTTAQVRRRQRSRRTARRVGLSVGIVTVAYGVSIAFGVGDRATDARLLAIGLGLIVVTLLVDLLHRHVDARHGRLLDQLVRLDVDAPRRRPKGLAAAESSVALALRSAEGTDRWFRGDIRLVVHDRCSVPDAPIEVAARGEAHADVAGRQARLEGLEGLAGLEGLVDPATWDLIRPDRPKATTRDPGLSVATMTRILDDVERL